MFSAPPRRSFAAWIASVLLLGLGGAGFAQQAEPQAPPPAGEAASHGCVTRTVHDTGCSEMFVSG